MAKEAAESHAVATEQTTKMITDAESRAAAAETRAREAIAAATKRREETKAESERMVARARREAEQIMHTARTQSEHSLAQARADAEKQISEVRHELDSLVAKRDAVKGQLTKLREVIGSFAGLDSLDHDPEKSIGEAPAAEVVAVVEEAVAVVDEPIAPVGEDDPSVDDATTIVRAQSADDTTVERPSRDRSVRRANLGGPAAADLAEGEDSQAS
jgi:cell division septum initiation protein DivIVA